jgi:hypothetical protein
MYWLLARAGHGDLSRWVVFRMRSVAVVRTRGEAKILWALVPFAQEMGYKLNCINKLHIID